MKEETNIIIYDIELILERDVVHVVENKKYPIKSYIFKAYTDFSLKKIKLYEGREIQYFTLEEAKNKEDISPTILDVIYKIEDKL